MKIKITVMIKRGILRVNQAWVALKNICPVGLLNEYFETADDKSTLFCMASKSNFFRGGVVKKKINCSFMINLQKVERIEAN